eukprot:4495867-Pleurochrysis_carterae.AAC.2
MHANEIGDPREKDCHALVHRNHMNTFAAPLLSHTEHVYECMHGKYDTFFAVRAARRAAQHRSWLRRPSVPPASPGRTRTAPRHRVLWSELALASRCSFLQAFSFHWPAALHLHQLLLA